MTVDFTSFTIGCKISVVVAEPGQHLELREQFHILRAREFGEWERKVGHESDDFDPRAAFLLAVSGGVVIGGCRIIDGSLDPINLDPALVGSERHCELSRFLIPTGRRGIVDRALRLRVKAELMLVINRYCFETKQYQSLYCDTMADFARGLVHCFGSAIEILGSEHLAEKPGATLLLIPFRVTRRGASPMRRKIRAVLAWMRVRRLWTWTVLPKTKSRRVKAEVELVVV